MTAGPNGAVHPSGSFFVLMGYPITLSFTPDADYYAADVLVDGQSLGARRSFTFSNVTNGHTVSATFLANPAVTFVSTNGANLCPYDTWEKAATTIQDAVNVVHSGGTVLASNGVYAAGGATVYGMSNRVALTRAVTLQSVNGPEATAICGQGPFGEGAVRCAYLTNGAALVGFTLTNGFTRNFGDGDRAQSGGGAWLDRGGTVSNCIARNNRAHFHGGGLFCNYGGTTRRCAVSGNTASTCAGGVYCHQGGTVQNCAVNGNSADDGGGLYCYQGGVVQNCTVSENWTYGNGSGAYCMNGGSLVNTIVFGNFGGFSSNICAIGTGMSFTNCCTAPAVSGTGNIAADPKFAKAPSGDYRLQTNSPCINAGINQDWMSGATDLDGRPRLIHGTVDIGAYEALLPGRDEDADGLPDEWEWNQARTLTGLAPDADADGDGADNLAAHTKGQAIGTQRTQRGKGSLVSPWCTWA